MPQLTKFAFLNCIPQIGLPISFACTHHNTKTANRKYSSAQLCAYGTSLRDSRGRRPCEPHAHRRRIPRTHRRDGRGYRAQLQERLRKSRPSGSPRIHPTTWAPDTVCLVIPVPNERENSSAVVGISRQPTAVAKTGRHRAAELLETPLPSAIERTGSPAARI